MSTRILKMYNSLQTGIPPRRNLTLHPLIKQSDKRRGCQSIIRQPLYFQLQMQKADRLSRDSLFYCERILFNSLLVALQIFLTSPSTVHKLLPATLSKALSVKAMY